MSLLAAGATLSGRPVRAICCKLDGNAERGDERGTDRDSSGENGRPARLWGARDPQRRRDRGKMLQRDQNRRGGDECGDARIHWGKRGMRYSAEGAAIARMAIDRRLMAAVCRRAYRRPQEGVGGDGHGNSSCDRRKKLHQQRDQKNRCNPLKLASQGAAPWPGGDLRAARSGGQVPFVH